MDGETEVWGELQPLQSSDRETRRALCQLSEDRSPHGFPQRVLRSPQTTGVFVSTRLYFQLADRLNVSIKAEKVV